MQKTTLPGVALAAITAILLSSVPADATVFTARSEMFEVAFPQADTVDAKDYFLTKAQRAAIQQLAIAALDSDLITVYTARRGDEILGHAILDTHLVRTLPETFLVVLDPDGTVAATHILAFHEPLEYMPSNRWLALLEDRSLTDDLRLGRDIAGVTGSTLSSRAVLGGVRRALAIYEVLLSENN
jgi:transcriptional regulator of nitric oxide reductase